MSKKPGVKGMSRKQRAATMIAIREQHAGRSPRAVSMDARQTAKRTLEPETDDLHPWQQHPNRYDMQGVDTRVIAKKPKAAEKPVPTKNWKVIAKHKWVAGAIITESHNKGKSTPKKIYSRFTATIRGYQNWRICEGFPNECTTQDIIDKVQSIRDRIDAGDETVFKKQDSVKIITKNLPDGYEIHKWSYVDRAGKHTVHAVLLDGEPIFEQNKTFESLTDARKAVKEHVSSEISRKRNIADRKQLEEKGYIGKPLKKTRKAHAGQHQTHEGVDKGITGLH